MKNHSENYNPIDITPLERVFHIDRECYIIYLGSDPADYKPFLRIGTSRNLSEEIINSTYYIVITDSLTGNPLLEPENMNTANPHENRYVGDEKNLKDFFNFLRCFNIKTDGYPIRDNIQTENNKAVLYFYDDGNLELHYNKKSIFNLHRREKEDLHFIELAKKVKEQLKYDPLLIDEKILKQKPGFFVINQRAGVVINGRLHFTGMPLNYFESIAKARIDPDTIESLIIDRAEELNEDFINLLKRSLTTGKKLTVCISDAENKKLINCTAELFNSKKKICDTIDLYNREIELDGVRIFSDQFSVRFDLTDGYSITVEKKEPHSPKLQEKDGEYILNPGKKTLTFYKNGTTFSIPVLENTVYQIEKDSPPSTEELKSNIEKMFSFFRGVLTDRDSSLANVLLTVFKTLPDTALIERQLSRIDRMIKKLPEGRESYIILTTLVNSIIALLPETDNTKNLTKRLQKYSKRLKSNFERPGKKTPALNYVPVLGTIYNLDIPLIIYRLTRDTLSRTDIVESEEISERISSAVYGPTPGSIPLFENEIAKLGSLIKKLSISRVKKAASPAEQVSGEKPVKENLLPKEHKPGEHKLEHKLDIEEKQPESVTRTPYSEEKEIISGIDRGKTGKELKKSEKSKKRAGKKKIRVMLYTLPAIIVVAILILFLKSGQFTGNTGQDQRAEQQTKLYLKNKKDETHVKSAKKQEEENQSGKGEAFTALKTEGKKMQNEEPAPKETENSSGINTSEREKIEKFLDLGYVKLTILDIYKLTNKIAFENGYRRLYDPEELGRDPDWIYPGNVFKLPDGSRYIVKKGDTIWYIAKRFIKNQLDRDWPVYKNIENQIKRDKISLKDKQKTVKILKDLKSNLYSENFRNLTQNLTEILNRK